MINKVIIRAKSALRRMKSKKGQTLVELRLDSRLHFRGRYLRSDRLGQPGEERIYDDHEPARSRI